MKKQQTKESLYSDELEQLNFDQAEQDVHELFEQEGFPTSSELEKYNQLMPGGAERVFNLIEDERMHQREMEKKQLKGRNALNSLMTIFGFCFSCFLLIIINDLTISGSSWVALALGWLTIMVVLVLTFAPYIKSRLSNKD